LQSYNRCRWEKRVSWREGLRGEPLRREKSAVEKFFVERTSPKREPFRRKNPTSKGVSLGGKVFAEETSPRREERRGENYAYTPAHRPENETPLRIVFLFSGPSVPSNLKAY
jgi:hypothetical protein